MSFDVGARVETEKNGKGRVAFCGTTSFADGEWVGVELDEPKGKNDGTVQGVPYFSCEDKYGLFVRPSQLKLEGAKMSTAKAPGSALKAPAPASLRKEKGGSGRPSPGASPRMSPAVSMEKLNRVQPPPKKVSSATKLSDLKSSEKPKPKSSVPPHKVAAVAVAKVEAKAPTPPPPAVLNQTPKSVPVAPAKSVESIAAEVEEPINIQTQQVANESVLSRVKKMQEVAPPSSPTTSSSSLPFKDISTECEYYKAQAKELQERLENMREKRKEDRAQLIEFDNFKMRAQAVMDLKNKLADHQLELQRELQEAKKEAQELREWRDIKQEEMSSGSELLELATIDKEMAEEKAEQLQSEVDYLKEKVEGLEADLEILREEMAAAGEGGGIGAAPVGNSVQMKQIEQQNEKLKAALIKLRDLNGQATADKLAAVKEAEILRLENGELLRIAEMARKSASDAELRIQEMQEQIEASMGSEEMIVVLTSKNLDMEEQIAKLEQDLEDLEALRDMDEQIAETQKQVEKDLLLDIETAQMRTNEVLSKLKQEEKHSDQLMETIMKFRKKTNELNEEIQDFKDQILRYEEQLSGQRSEENSVASMVSQLQVNASRSFAESVERQLSAIELEFAGKQIEYLRAFQPDNFTKPGGDNDSVILSVLFPRLSAKSKLLSKLMAERYPGVPGGPRREHVTKSHKAEQWAHSARVAHICDELITVCGQFESDVQTTSLERLAVLAQKQKEMTVHEKAVNGYLELLRQGRLDENTSLDNLQKAVNYFKQVFFLNVGTEGSASATEWVTAVSKQILSSFAWCRVNLQRIEFLLMPGSESSIVGQLVASLREEITQGEQLAMKSSKRVPTERQLKLTTQFTDNAQAIVSNLDRLAMLLHDACGIASTQISINSDVDGFEVSRMQEIIHGCVEKNFGSTPLEKAFDPISKGMWGVREGLSQIFTALEGGLMEVEKEENRAFPAMLERAHQRKQAAAEAEGLRWQLDKKDAEILDIKKVIKSRNDDISNYKLRLDMAEARMDSFGKQDSVKSQHLESKIDQMVADHRKKQIEFDEQVDSLQKELKEMERENQDLKERAKTLSKKALFQGIQTMENRSANSLLSSPVTPTSPALNRAELNLLEHQLAESQASLRRATLEIIQLRAEVATTGGGVLKIPDAVCGPNTLKASHTHDEPLDIIEKEAYQLKRDELKYMVFVPDYNRPRHIQEEDKKRFDSERDAYHHKVQTLRARLHRYWSEQRPGQTIPRLFGIENMITMKKPAPVTTESKEFKDICTKWGIAV